MHNLLILSKHAQEYRRLVASAALHDLHIFATHDLGVAQANCSHCDLVFGEPGLVVHVLPNMPRLQWVQATWAGVEPLLAPGLRRDYTLTNVRSIFGPLMSEFVFAYLLLHERRILQRLSAQQAGRWDNTLTGTLRGKTLGLLGVGSIGAHLASTARHFDMLVRGYTRSSQDSIDVHTYYHGDQLLEFATGLDYLVNVLPNTSETYHLIDARLLAALPAHAVLVNTGRGSAIDEAALADALQTGRLAGAVLDVFQEEPLPPEHIFWRTPNLFITGHTAAPSFPSDIAGLFIENYHRLLRGEALNHRVDFQRGY
jgi:phosphoglycerate dehydrogenase-like enzyme